MMAFDRASNGKGEAKRRGIFVRDARAFVFCAMRRQVVALCYFAETLERSGG
jgi:hypothetical protein